MKKDCKIENGILLIDKGRTVIESHEFTSLQIKKVVIPEGVKSIEYWAFGGCKQLEEIILPSTLEEISSEAFPLCPISNIIFTDGCPNIREASVHSFYSTPWYDKYMKENEFFILGKVLVAHKKGNKTVTIPKNVESVSSSAFESDGMVELVIPNTVKNIGEGAFLSCNKLKKIKFESNIILDEEVFGYNFPSSLIDDVENILPHLADKPLKKYLLNPKIWQKLNTKTQAKIFIRRQTKPFITLYKKCINEAQAEDLCAALFEILPSNATSSDCNNVASCMMLLCSMISAENLKQLYNWLASQKNAEKALASLKENVLISTKLWNAPVIKNSTSLEQIVTKAIVSEKIDTKELILKLKTYYGITPKDLPTLLAKDGTPVSEMVLAYLLTAHEEEKKKKSKINVEVKNKNAGISATAQEIINELDTSHFKKAIETIVDTLYIGSGTSKKKFLAYPICRYADEETMARLTALAPLWLNNLNVIFKYFYKAAFYNNTKSAMLFIDTNNGMEDYATIRGVTAQEIRDTRLACLEPNTNEDLKKAIIKNHSKALFRIFLSGEEYTAENWGKAYLQNPLLVDLAQRLVWSQGDVTFLPTNEGLILSDGSPYELTDKSIKLAHPIDVDISTLRSWQKLFTKRQIKQPFEQIWEPVVNINTFSKSRFSTTPIPYFVFCNEVDRGITIKKFNEGNDVYIYFKNCNVQLERLDFLKHFVDDNDCFLIKNFDFEEFNRQTNHIIAYLDVATAEQRVIADDFTISDVFQEFTFAKIVELIELANKNNAINVLSMLLEYKNKNFADFDPMDEFVLE